MADRVRHALITMTHGTRVITNGVGMPALLPARDPAAHAVAYASRLGWRIGRGHRYRPRGGCGCRELKGGTPCPAPGAHPLPHWAADTRIERLKEEFRAAPGAGVIAATTAFDAVVLPRRVGMAAMVCLDRQGPTPCLLRDDVVVLLVQPRTGGALANLAVEIRAGDDDWIALPPSHGVMWDTPPWDDVTGDALTLRSGLDAHACVAEAFRLTGGTR